MLAALPTENRGESGEHDGVSPLTRRAERSVNRPPTASAISDVTAFATFVALTNARIVVDTQTDIYASDVSLAYPRKAKCSIDRLNRRPTALPIRSAAASVTIAV